MLVSTGHEFKVSIDIYLTLEAISYIYYPSD